MKKVILVMSILASTILPVSATLLDDATNFIANEETFSPTVYTCPAGKRTIGYGCTDAKVLAKGRISEKEARTILRARVEKELAWVTSLLPYLTNGQKIAVTSLVFNIGRTRFIKSQAYQRLKERKLLRAMHEISEFRLVKGKICQGLVDRRKRELSLFAC